VGLLKHCNVAAKQIFQLADDRAVFPWRQKSGARPLGLFQPLSSQQGILQRIESDIVVLLTNNPEPETHDAERTFASFVQQLFLSLRQANVKFFLDIFVS
jgi:hypothetical protein